MGRVLLAAPRSFCAGVDRAIEIVERLLEQHGAPVYVRHQIVHNENVVRRLEGLGGRLLAERNRILVVLGRQWWEALLATVGRWAFDYATLARWSAASDACCEVAVQPSAASTSGSAIRRA